MDKRTKARLEREKLNEMIKSSPKLKAFLDAATDETENQDLKDLIQPVLVDTFDKIRLQGINIGWHAHAMQCKKKIESCDTLEQAIKLMSKEVQETADKLGIKVEEDG